MPPGHGLMTVPTEFWHLPATLAKLAFGGLLAVEVALAGLLLLGRPPTSLLATLCFLIVVSASPAAQLAVGSDLSCGCTGGDPAGDWAQWPTLARNAGLAAACTLGLHLARR